jgi:GTP-binding protein EngB required for normal cell division
MGDVLASFEAREKYRYFRILVIGRANAGKTTLLKRVCNTTEEPCIYDEKSNSLVRFLHSYGPSSPLIAQRKTSWSRLQR